MVEHFREPEDLLSDESFLSWYFKTGEGNGTFWETWMAQSPDHRALVEEAIALLDKTRIREKEVSPSQVEQAESALRQKIDGISGEQPAVVLPLWRQHPWIAAASILLVLTAGLILSRQLHSSQPALATHYGEVRQQQLPDGSEVMVDANSQLTWSPDWKEGADREVWIKGEAFFHVRKTPSKSRFIVHTDPFDIIVTGTRFNVMNRKDKVNVLLQEGSVLLHLQDGSEVRMTPGDFVQWDGNGLEKRMARQDSILAWKEQKLIFDKTPLRDLVRIIHDQYGVEVELGDDSVGNQTVSGMLPNNNLDVLLKALEATSEFDIIRQNGRVSIRRHIP